MNSFISKEILESSYFNWEDIDGLQLRISVRQTIESGYKYTVVSGTTENGHTYVLVCNKDKIND